MNWYKQANWEGRDPYSVDFTYEAQKSKQMETDELIGALSDAIEAAGTSVNQGKYTDQASVYRQELTSRGISIPEQDAMVRATPSLHSNFEESKPCKDKITRERTEPENPRDHTFDYYPNVEKSNYYSPQV